MSLVFYGFSIPGNNSSQSSCEWLDSYWTAVTFIFKYLSFLVLWPLQLSCSLPYLGCPVPWITDMWKNSATPFANLALWLPFPDLIAHAFYCPISCSLQPIVNFSSSFLPPFLSLSCLCWPTFRSHYSISSTHTLDFPLISSMMLAKTQYVS